MYGFSTRRGTNFLIGSFAYPLGTGGYPAQSTTRAIYYEPDTDSYVYGPTSEKFTRVVEFLRTAYADGILDPDYASMSQDVFWNKLTNGQMMSVFDNSTFVNGTFNPTLQQAHPDARFDILAPMANEDGVIRGLGYNYDWPAYSVAISSQTKYPERVVEMLNWLYTEEGMLISNFGIENEHYTYNADGDIIMTEATVAKYQTDGAVGSAVVNAFRTDLGLGLQNMALYVDEGLINQFLPYNIKYF